MPRSERLALDRGQEAIGLQIVVLHLGSDEQLRPCQTKPCKRPAEIGLVAVDLGRVEGAVSYFCRCLDGSASLSPASERSRSRVGGSR